MTIRIVCAPARPVRWSLVTTVAAALAVFAVPAVHAQAPAPAPATKPKPPAAAPKPPAAAPKPPAAQAAPPQQQAAAPPQAQMPNFVYTPWVKVCAAPPAQNGQPAQKQVCFTSKDARTDQGVPIVAAQLVEMEGEATKILRITLPFGVAVQQGMRLIVDQDQPLPGMFVTCMPVAPNLGCVTQYEATPDLVNKLKKGQMLTVQAINLQNQVISFPLALNDFAKANEGPPTDPKAYEEQQKKMQDDLQKKADELRKKLEQQQGTPAAPK